MRILFTIACLIVLSQELTAQSAKLVWASQMKGNSFDVCQAITTDPAGNIYATGYFSSTNDFDPGPGVFNLQSVNAEDIFLAKYRP
ncbi:MAG TPA: SBBP repeat-containing protein, partial [Ferruginibacter sp.]|nr:SBBP repeat-containing protein [Ferruginibacter sp.]